MQSRTYEVGRSTITLRFGDLTSSKAEAVVSSDDYLLSMGGGVSRAIRRAGGASVAADASKMTPARPGDVVVSTAGNLPARYVLHAITIGPGPDDPPADAVVRQATRRVMELLPLLGCSSVAFPAIGAGAAGIPYEVVASEMAGELVNAVLDTDGSYQIELYLMDRFGQLGPEDFFVFFEEFAARRLGLSAARVAKATALTPPAAAAPALDPAQTAEAERRHQVYLMLRHLDARRNQIEGELLKALAAPDVPHDGSLARLKQQLEELQALRRGYEAELGDEPRAAPAPVPNSVFVSSTSLDLKTHRLAVRDVVKNLGLRFIGMEEFHPTAQAPADFIRRKVNEGRVYLGILGMRYGSVDPGSGLSMTELEYRQAVASNKHICMFVMDPGAPITVGMVEDDPTRFAKLHDFRGRVLKAHTCALFTDPPDLARKAEAALKDHHGA